MRILVVTNLYPPHAFGGYEDLCAGAVRAWRSAGCEVEVLTSRWRRDDVAADAAAPDGETVHRLLPIYWHDHRLLAPPLHTQARWEQRTRTVVSQLAAGWSPDVVSVWNAAALPFGLFNYVARGYLPVVLVVGDRWLEWALRMDPWAEWFTLRWGRGLARPITAATGLSTRVEGLGRRVIGCFASEYLRRRADERGRWRLDEAALVPHGLDHDRYPVVDRAAQAPPWRGRLLYVGRVAPEKGLATAIRALARRPDIRIEVIGTGDRHHLQELADLAVSLGVDTRLRFSGEAGPDELRAAYLAADAIVFPSTWHEPFGIVPLEAMACGTPVIATGTGGSGEFLIDPVSAVRFAPHDDAGLADAVERLARDPALRSQLRRNGFEVARWLSRGRTFEHLLAWHRHAADPDVPAPGDRPVLPPWLRADAIG